MKPSKDFDTLYEQYNQLMKVRGYRTGNGRMYPYAIEEFFSFLRERGYVEFHVNREDLTAYYVYLKTRPNKKREGLLSQSTINHHLLAIRLLFDLLLQNGVYSSLPLIPKYLRGESTQQEILSQEEIKALYDACEHPLERALLSVGYGCGLRRSEMANLLVTDINLVSGFLIVRHGKGNKRREVPLSDTVIHDLRDYIQNGRINGTRRKVQHLLVSPYGNALSGKSLNNLLKVMISRVPTLAHRNISLHALRRSIATHLAENGAGIHFIKDFLGHTLIDTAQLYAIRRKRQTKLY